MKKPTKKQLEALVIELSIQHHQADLAVKRRRYDLNEEYACYFRVCGEIEPGFRGIRPDDPRYAGVVAYTADAYERLLQAKQARRSAKRRLDTAVRRLMILTGASFAVPDAAPAKRPPPRTVRRTTIHGETLQ
ncbi:hypothetical protein M6G63_18735 [Pseudomonas sp. BYT-5]|uniref:hypothetical protein n=1 Tax=unclassified Pseudomonas TaxID=196821 RepID=UPI0020216901|nr:MULTISPECIES: hypothetical protein [unclassified Pseudomonas]URD41462.1 hypothetical protein M6G63_18735 [Pseudomonas sp. BYT-5]URK96813.1 hypothetical protein J5X93_19400 [Pseudomonas sp. BYT-1]